MIMLIINDTNYGLLQYCFVLIVVGLQPAVMSGLVHLHYKQRLLSTSMWQTYGSLGLRCLSSIPSLFGSTVLPSLQLVCCFCI